jgi:hypothetical protein
MNGTKIGTDELKERAWKTQALNERQLNRSERNRYVCAGWIHLAQDGVR